MTTFSLTKTFAIEPILTLRSPLPLLEEKQKTNCRAIGCKLIRSEVIARIIAVFTSLFAAMDALTHFIIGTYKGAYLLARTICCLSSKDCQKAVVFAHFQRSIFFLGCTLVGSIAGVIWPELLKGFCSFPSENFSESIVKGLLEFDNSKVKGQIHGLYIITNETNLENTYQLCKDQNKPSTKTIHIGCAGWHNFDLMCFRRSQYGLLIDFNPKNAEFMKKTIAMIQSCESRQVFKKAMIDHLHSLIGEERALVFHEDQQDLPTNRIEKELSREGSWLQTEEKYLYIKMLASHGCIIPITEDMTNFKSFNRLRKFLDLNHVQIDTLYLSNICNFMHTPEKKAAFEKSVKSLLDQETIFINCPKKISSHCSTLILHQKARLGKEVLENTFPSSQLFEEIDT